SLVPRHLPSFPTRRSSDLRPAIEAVGHSDTQVIVCRQIMRPDRVEEALLPQIIPAGNKAQAAVTAPDQMADHLLHTPVPIEADGIEVRGDWLRRLDDGAHVGSQIFHTIRTDKADEDNAIDRI